jgi:hypothetical protein
MAMNVGELTRELEELIAALDRRVPRVERAGEATIAREAAALREKAVASPGRTRQTVRRSANEQRPGVGTAAIRRCRRR